MPDNFALIDNVGKILFKRDGYSELMYKGDSRRAVEKCTSPIPPQYYYLMRNEKELSVSHLRLEVDFISYDNYNTHDSYLLKQIT